MKVNKLRYITAIVCSFIAALWSQAQCMENVPAGCMMDFAGEVAPRGWLMCNGEVHSNQKYPELFDTINTKFVQGVKLWVIEANNASLNEKLFCVPDQGGKIISVGKINILQYPNFNLSFSSDLSIDNIVQESINYYASISNWIWHAVTAGNSTCDYKSMTFKSLDIMESNIKLLILEKLNSGNFSDALSIISVFDRLTMNVQNSYTWGETKTHIRLLIPKLGKYVKEQSYNFFNNLLQTNQFSQAYNLATAHRTIDENLANEWILTVKGKSK